MCNMLHTNKRKNTNKRRKGRIGIGFFLPPLFSTSISNFLYSKRNFSFLNLFSFAYLLFFMYLKTLYKFFKKIFFLEVKKF